MRLLMSHIYNGESIVDVQEHIEHLLNDSGLPVDDYNMLLGKFKVTVEWEDNE